MLIYEVYISDDGQMLPESMMFTDMPSVILVPQLNQVGGRLTRQDKVYRREQFAAPSPFTLQFVRDMAISLVRQRKAANA